MNTTTNARWRRLACCGFLVTCTVVMTVAARSRAGENTPAEASGQCTAKVCGLHIVGTCFPESPGLASGSAIGTTVTFLVTYTGDRLLKFDPEASRITVFSDDRGSDLMERCNPYHSQILEQRTGRVVSSDGKHATVDLHVKMLPTPGARELHVKGALVFKRGGELKTVRGPVVLEAGARAEVGPFAIRVTHVEIERYGDPHLDQANNKIHFEFEIQDPDTIKSFKLVDAFGVVISSSRGYGRHTTNERTIYKVTEAVRRDTRSATIELSYFGDSGVVEAPLDATVSIGW